MSFSVSTWYPAAKGKIREISFTKSCPIFCEILGLCEKQFNSDENYKMLFTPSLDELCSFRFPMHFFAKFLQTLMPNSSEKWDQMCLFSYLSVYFYKLVIFSKGVTSGFCYFLHLSKFIEAKTT